MYKSDCPLTAIGLMLFFFGFKWENFHPKIKGLKNVYHQLVFGIAPPLRNVDLEAVAKALRWFRQQHTKAFQICSTSKDLFLFLLCSTIPSKEVAFIGRGFAGRNVWLSVCVLVAWSWKPVSAITTGNDWPFALKSQQTFSLFLLSLETQGNRPAPLLHCWCSALTLLCSPLRALPPNGC